MDSAGRGARKSVSTSCYDARVKYRWQLCSPDPQKVALLCKELGVSHLVAELLINRGVEEPAAAYRFLNPSLSQLHDPYLMMGMGCVVERVFRAIERREKILIYGDYDVDGITSTVVLRRALEMLGGEVDYYIPRRLEEGYGLKKDVVRGASEQGVGLLISVDSGIRDLAVAEHARELGLDLIVTDHHLPGDVLPDAYAVLNPKQEGCPYPDKDLAAVGVVLKLVDALFKKAGKSDLVHHFLKVVAIGTVADMVPLNGENRVIVSYGLSALSEPYNLGLQTLLEGAGIGREVDNFDIGFKLAPRINAFTRMGGGSEVVDLFSVRDPDVAAAIVGEMNDKNTARRQEEERILREIDERFRAGEFRGDDSFLLLTGNEWHRGVIGNVASRMVERYYRPVLVISIGEDTCQGSGRSVQGFHLLEALDHCAEAFERYGGHAQAVGCTLKREYATPEGIQDLAQKLRAYAGVRLGDDLTVPLLQIDALLDPMVLNLSLMEEIDKLAPFGMGNPVPVFASPEATISRGPWTLKDRHLKMQLMGANSSLDAIWWNRAEAGSSLAQGNRVEIAYTLSRDSYQGRSKLLLTVKDLHS